MSFFHQFDRIFIIDITKTFLISPAGLFQQEEDLAQGCKHS